jgi:hypothetical protein
LALAKQKNLDLSHFVEMRVFIAGRREAMACVFIPTYLKKQTLQKCLYVPVEKYFEASYSLVIHFRHASPHIRTHPLLPYCHKIDSMPCQGPQRVRWTIREQEAILCAFAIVRRRVFEKTEREWLNDSDGTLSMKPAHWQRVTKLIQWPTLLGQKDYRKTPIVQEKIEELYKIYVRRVRANRCTHP